MPENAQMEKGHLYRHEDPTFHKGETGKGVSIGGGHKDNPSTTIKVEGDSYASKLKGMWSKATGAVSHFKRSK